MQALDESELDRIPHAGHDDRDRRCRLVRGLCHCRGSRDNDLHLETDEVHGETGETVHFSVSESCFDRDVAPFHPSERQQALSKSVEGRIGLGGTATENAHPVDLAGLLGLDHERCGDEQRGDEGSELH